MKIPVSWLKEFVDIHIPIEDLAHRLTIAGLEVEEIRYVGLPMPASNTKERTAVQLQPDIKISGLEWDPDKIVVGAISEVMPHPNADRLVLVRLDDGRGEHIVLTGAPNLFEYKGKGILAQPLKVAYAKEGACIYDGHQPGQVLTTLKRAKIRGVESYSMACSEKELGISDEHEGIIILDEDAPVGMPLVDYMGDAVLDISITPNMARDLSVLGVAREISALTGEPLHPPSLELQASGPPVEGQASVEILNPELNPRFVLGLIRDVRIGPSSYKIQRRLRLAGMRPINNIVDATNYAMLDWGEPLHAFDYDILVQRAGGKAPALYTRTAQPGEHLTTLDGVDRALDDFTVLVCDSAGALSIAGVMGGTESEVNERTRNILLEGAGWNFINIRKTANAQHLMSEAAYRFSRGVHPSLASQGVRRGLQLMHAWAKGEVAQGLIDNYPLPPVSPVVKITPDDVHRWLGIQLTTGQIAGILRRLEFQVEETGEAIQAVTPDFRMDISEGIVGVADLMEEVARIYGYERIPETRMADQLPPQFGNPKLDKEERVRDILVEYGLQEVINYRMTTPSREARRLSPDSPADDRPYLRLVNPLSSDREVMRHTVLASVLEVAEHNAHLRARMTLFEIGPAFMACEGGEMPDELLRLVIVMTGPRELPYWEKSDNRPMDFYDLKGILEGLFDGLHIENIHYEPGEYPSFHPGKSAKIYLGEHHLGVIGELHPRVRERYDLSENPVLAADLDLDLLLFATPGRYESQPVPAFPPVLEDLALVVDESVPADQVEQAIRQAGGKMVTGVRLFDVYRGGQTGPGKKSLAYSLTYQDPERTLTDEEVAKIRQRIVRRLEQGLGARLRS